MQKELTITIDAEVYQGLQTMVDPKNGPQLQSEHEADLQRISKFVEELVRSYVMQQNLELAYAEMAQDETREAEALAWVEATIGDVAGEAW